MHYLNYIINIHETKSLLGSIHSCLGTCWHQTCGVTSLPERIAPSTVPIATVQGFNYISVTTFRTLTMVEFASVLYRN